MPDLLIELFSEEIPARMQARAAADLKRLVTDGLVEAGLTYAHAGALATPRRLVLALEGVAERSPDSVEERRGPKVGAPEKAVEGFLRGAGVARDDLEVREDKKGEVYFARIRRAGRPAAAIVAEVLEATIRGFPWPKSMRWGAGSLRWVRPLHRILCILTGPEGHEVVPLEVEGIRAGDVTEGHRFMAPGEIRISSFEEYQARLKRAFVMLDPEERAETIRSEAQNMAFAGGLEVAEDAGLLAEVAGLVEWPVVLMGEIEARFLDLPPEVLQTSMREHQKFFSVRDPGTGRIVRFVTVANRETDDHGATILAGNRRVLAARLADAAFFWENDLAVAKAGMGAWREALGSVTFHAKLGSEADRVERIAALARELAPSVGADAEAAERAARLAKADLVSEMVYEFPELQGVMGRYYAQAAGEAPEVAAAVAEHYAPLGPSDAVPTAPVSVAVSLAEKIDKLTGFWVTSLAPEWDAEKEEYAEREESWGRPTGSRDPYALRRAALGVIQILLENDIRFSLLGVLKKHGPRVRDDASAEFMDNGEPIERDSYKNIRKKYDLVALAEAGRRTAAIGYNEFGSEQAEALLSFFHDRLKSYERELGYPHDIVSACIGSSSSDDLVKVHKTVPHLSDFLKTEDGENLLLGFKRANNILTQAEAADGVEYSFGADATHARTEEERALFAALEAQGPVIEKAVEREDFGAAMAGLARLRAPIDAFFEAVQINTDTQILRRNRLNLLSEIRTLCLGVADLTRIEG